MMLVTLQVCDGPDELSAVPEMEPYKFTYTGSAMLFRRDDGAVVGQHWVTVGDGGYDGCYETVESGFWIDDTGYQRKIALSDVQAFIMSGRIQDAAGLAKFFEQQFQLGRVALDDGLLVDYNGLLERESVAPRIDGRVLTLITWRTPFHLDLNLPLPPPPHLHRLCEHRIDLDTCTQLSGKVLWERELNFKPAPPVSFKHAYLQQTGNGRLRPEEQRVQTECERRGIPFTLFTLKQIQRRQLPLTRETFVSGDMDAMHGAMKQLGIELPSVSDYPKCLARHLHRRVWQSTLGEVEQAIFEGTGLKLPVFAKPAGRSKLFTGKVFDSPDDLYGVSGRSRREPVWCSEVVSWVSEFRAYVIDGCVKSLDHYGGDAAIRPDRMVVDLAVQTFKLHGSAPIAYGIDFGVLSTGETALIEMNDGYALGAYQIGAEDYTDLLFQRWAELMTQNEGDDVATAS